MKTQKIGKSDLTSTRLAYGCMRISGTRERAKFTPEMEAAGKKALLAAWEAGYNHFDHADIYGKGLCEEIFGKLVKEKPELKKAVIATKCSIRWKDEPNPGDPHRWDFSKDYILKSCEGSLKRLNVDCIDLYILHRPDYLADPEEVAAAFVELKKSGKVKEFGVSNFRPSLLSMIQKYCPMPLICNQVEIHMARLDEFENGCLDQCLEHNITPVSWSPLAGGLLGDGGSVDPKDMRVAGLGALLNLLDIMAKKYNVSRTAISIAWLLKHPSKIIPIVGSVRPERIKDAVSADSIEMSREDWYTILTAARMQGLP